eukprot:9635691-Karenia_brevis.AAC.1
MEFIWKSERAHTSKIKFIDNKRVKRERKNKDDQHHPPSTAVSRNTHPPTGVLYRRNDAPTGE